MKPLRVFHLVYYGYEKTVVDSQVVAPARRLAASGIDVELIFLEDWIPWLLGRWRPKKAALFAAGIRCHFLPRIPRNIFGMNTRRLSGLVNRFFTEQSPIVIHARGFQGTDILLPLKKRWPALKVICDARGIEWAEYEMDVRAREGAAFNPTQSQWCRILEDIEKRAVAGSDVVFCVSRSMIPFLSGRAGRDTKDFQYVPCAVDVESFEVAMKERERIRASLGMGSGPTLVYAGSMSTWQVPDRSCEFAARFLKSEPSGYFLVLTPTAKEFERLAVSKGVPKDRLRVLSVSHREVPLYLAAADIALLLREENVVNRFACPTKFAEYLACGLHVLATAAVDEVASTIRETGCGTLIENPNDDSAVQNAIEKALSAVRGSGSRRQACASVARERYDWAIFLPLIEKWYRQLAASRST